MRNLMETNQNMPMAPAPAPPTITNCNVTRGGIMKSLETPEGRLRQIELLVIFTALLLLFLVTFGSFRRCCNSDKFRVIFFTGYTLSTYVLTYSLGLMHEAPCRNELFPIWALFLMIALGSADSLSAYRLEDNEQWKSYNWQLVIKGFWFALLLGLYIPWESNMKVAIYCLIFILVVKADERARALMAASQHSLEKNTKVVADFMTVEHTEKVADYLGVEHQIRDDSRGDVDPVCMTGYHYLVRGEEEKWVKDVLFANLHIICYPRKKKAALAPNYHVPLDKEDKLLTPVLKCLRLWNKKGNLITIEKVWKCEGPLLSSKKEGPGSKEGDPALKLKDICLSFALFKLLRLRYAGYSLPQEAHEKTWNLIHNGLLSNDEDSYKRAFRVVELELRFLFDFFYTKYGIIFQPSRLWLKLLESITVAMSIWATISILKDYNYKRLNNDCHLPIPPNGMSVEVLVTSIMIILFVTVELMQFFILCFCDWAKVIWICKYVQNENWHKKEWIAWMIRVICRVRLIKPWNQRLHQYSLLESYSYKPSRLLNNVTMAVYIDQTRDGQKQSRPIKLTEEVKQAVFHALKLNGTILKNGQASLERNNVLEKLLWACELQTQTQVILVWHIATSFCEHHDRLQLVGSDSQKMRTHFLVATSLSKYLAYLVAFAPRLLPDHPYVAEYVFDQAIIEARDFFGSCKRMMDRVGRMKSKGMGSSAHEETVINRGVRLGNQLVDDTTPKDMTWKILADFWVELVLYVAPSDDVKEHAKHLTRGGEFVTHLWALLSHAGIVLKSTPNMETSN